MIKIVSRCNLFILYPPLHNKFLSNKINNLFRNKLLKKQPRFLQSFCIISTNLQLNQINKKFLCPIHFLSIKYRRISSDYPLQKLGSSFEVLSPRINRFDDPSQTRYINTFSSGCWGFSEGRGPDLLYLDATMPLRGWNWLTRVAAIVPAKHLLEIQTANRNAEKGIGDGMCSPVCGRNARGKRNKQEGGVTSKLCEKTGIIKKQGWCSCDTRYSNCYTEAATLFFFSLFPFFFTGANFFDSLDSRPSFVQWCWQGRKQRFLKIISLNLLIFCKKISSFLVLLLLK